MRRRGRTVKRPVGPGRRVGNLPTFAGVVGRLPTLQVSLTDSRHAGGMSNYRRLKLPGSTWFFTVNLAERGSARLIGHIDLLRAAYRATVAEHPLFCDAMVILPDHLHAVWTLPPGDSDFSTRWRKIKARFTHATGVRQERSWSKERKREAGLWQRRFWEHCIRDEAEYRRAVTFCLTDPITHGLAKAPEDWVFSTIHRDKRAGRQLKLV